MLIPWLYLTIFTLTAALLLTLAVACSSESTGTPDSEPLGQASETGSQQATPESQEESEPTPSPTPTAMPAPTPEATATLWPTPTATPVPPTPALKATARPAPTQPSLPAPTQPSLETDRETLIALYNATSGPDWDDHENWLSDEPLDEWYGVSTDGNSRVIRLSLKENRLSGKIPPELSSLGNLAELDLGFTPNPPKG